MRYTQKHPQHTYTKRDVYYFSRVIPSDLRNHYTKPRIIQSLKTKSAHYDIARPLSDTYTASSRNTTEKHTHD